MTNIAVEYVCRVHVRVPICKTRHSNSPESVIQRSIKTNLSRTLKMKDAVNTSSSNIKETVAIKHQPNGEKTIN